MCDLYFDSGKYRGPEDDPDGWHVRAVLGVKKDENSPKNKKRNNLTEIPNRIVQTIQSKQDTKI